MNHSIQCVHCKAVLKSATPVPAGKKVKCPKCKQVFTTPEAEVAPTPAPVAPAAPEPAGGMSELDDMDAAIAKLEAEQTFGKKPAAPAPQPVAQAPAPAPVSAPSEDDDMDAAIAKLEAEQTFTKAPVAPAPKPAPVVQAAPVVEAAPVVDAIPDMEIPEIDDDLVVPDEPEPVPEVVEAPPSSMKKKPRAEQDDDEPRSKKKKERDDDDDEPRSKKKKDRDDEDNDEPRSKKKKERDDDDDDEPRSKKKKDPDERDDDEPRSSKKKDRDDDKAFSEKKKSDRRDDDDEPRSKSNRDDDDDGKKKKRDDKDDDGDNKKKKKKARSPMMLILVGVGAVLGLFMCCGCGVGSYFIFFSGPITGTWEPTNQGGGSSRTIHFGYFGRGSTKEKHEDFMDKGSFIETTTHFKYSLTRGDPMKLEMIPTSVDVKHSNPARQKQMEEEARKFADKINVKNIPNDLKFGELKLRFDVRLDGDTMTLTMTDPFPGVADTMRRVR